MWLGVQWILEYLALESVVIIFGILIAIAVVVRIVKAILRRRRASTDAEITR